MRCTDILESNRGVSRTTKCDCNNNIYAEGKRERNELGKWGTKKMQLHRIKKQENTYNSYTGSLREKRE